MARGQVFAAFFKTRIMPVMDEQITISKSVLLNLQRLYNEYKARVKEFEEQMR